MVGKAAKDCLLAAKRVVEATSDYSSKGGKVYISDTLLHWYSHIIFCSGLVQTLAMTQHPTRTTLLYLVLLEGDNLFTVECSLVFVN